MPKAFFGSISSDLATNIALHLQKNNWQIEGTYRKLNSKVEDLQSNGAKLYQLDFNNKSDIDKLFENKNIAKDWKFSMISPSIIGKLGSFGRVEWKEWIRKASLTVHNHYCLQSFRELHIDLCVQEVISKNA